MRLFEGTALDRPPQCERCERLETECVCVAEPPSAIAAERQTATIRIEKRKKGKMVTLVEGLAAGHPGSHFGDLLTTLKNKCGAGGTIQAELLEIQGDHRERLAEVLKQLGFRVKR